MLNETPRGAFYSKPRFADFPASEYLRRLSRVREGLAEKKVDALVLWDDHNIRYFSGFNSQHWDAKSIQPAVLVVPLERDPILVVPESFRGMAEATSSVADIRGYNRPHHVATLRELPRDVAKVVAEVRVTSGGPASQSRSHGLQGALPQFGLRWQPQPQGAASPWRAREV